jgi:hypothetical protein
MPCHAYGGIAGRRQHEIDCFGCESSCKTYLCQHACQTNLEEPDVLSPQSQLMWRLVMQAAMLAMHLGSGPSCLPASDLPSAKTFLGRLGNPPAPLPCSSHFDARLAESF